MCSRAETPSPTSVSSIPPIGLAAGIISMVLESLLRNSLLASSSTVLRDWLVKPPSAGSTDVMDLPFLEFPPEIREQIYRDVLSSANSRYEAVDPDEPAGYKYHLDILLANHQIYLEAKKVFQDNVFVKITTPWPEAVEHIRSEGKVPCVTIGDKASSFRDFHLWVFIDTPATPHSPEHHGDYSMLICLEDLEAFTQMWHFSNLNHFDLNRHLRLKLTIQDPHVPDRKIPKALQSRLLLPFGMIKDLHTFSVHGAKLLDSVQDNMNKERHLPDPSPEDCLEKGFALKDSGNQLLKRGSYGEALQKYIDAFAAVHITVSGRTRSVHAEAYYVRVLMHGAHKGMRGDYMRMILRIQLVSNIVHAYSKLEEWAEAHFWGKRSISLFRRSVTGDEREEIAGEDTLTWLSQMSATRFPAQDAFGKICYRTALASRKLGKIADVETLIRAAAVYLPNDKAVQDEAKALEITPGF